MKKLSEVNAEIKEILERFPKGCTDKGVEEKRLENRLLFLKTCKLCLENDPSEQFVKDQLELVRKKMIQIDAGFEEWKVDNPDSIKKNPLAAYHTECGFNTMKLQVKTLTYLLT